MNNGEGSRILPVLAAVLMLLAVSVGLTLTFLRTPQNRRFEESLLSAERALTDGSFPAVKRELLRASRHAISVSNWKELLKIAVTSIPADPRPGDYHLFTVLAGRGAAAIPGNPELSGYWTWGLLRSGNDERALKNLDLLKDPRWSSLRSEIRLNTNSLFSEQGVAAFQTMLDDNQDPDFMSQAGLLTESAEITFDAALLYMLSGRPQDAFSEALAVLNGQRQWNSDDSVGRRGVIMALAAIADDSGHRAEAIRWLELHLKDARRRRTVTWESLQFLGDMYWDRFRLTDDTESRIRASDAWREAMELVRQENDADVPQGNTWKLWVNLAVLEESDGNVTISRIILDEALTLFPERNEVKAAWARRNIGRDPALARRLIRSSLAENDDPILGITAMQVDPDAVSPRLYESRLWQLFEAVTDPGSTMQSVDRRLLVTFLLNYMTSRRSMASIDVAVDRYQKMFPDEIWIFPWRFAADASRNMAFINLVAPVETDESTYDKFRYMARSEQSWRALHDIAMFSLLASAELIESSRYFPKGDASIDPKMAEAGIMRVLESAADAPHVSGTPLGDRIDYLIRVRPDLQSPVKSLRSSGRSGRRAGAQASASMTERSKMLLNNALEDLSLALEDPDHPGGDDRSELLYLQALILKKTGRLEESVVSARSAVELNPDNARANELLLNEVAN